MFGWTCYLLHSIVLRIGKVWCGCVSVMAVPWEGTAVTACLLWQDLWELDHLNRLWTIFPFGKMFSSHGCTCLNIQYTWETQTHPTGGLSNLRLIWKWNDCICGSSLTQPLYLGYLCICQSRSSSIWFFTLAKFLLNPQAFRAGADPHSRWTVWMVSHL